MLQFSIKTIWSVALVAFLTTSAFAGKLDRVDIVKEGVDMKAAIVKANANDYSGFENSNHRFMVRVFAKAKGSNAIFATSISSKPNGVGTLFFTQSAKSGSKGWDVYKKSIAFNADMRKTHWSVSPGEACRENLKKQMQKGMRKQAVLSREWRTKAIATFYFRAAAASKAGNKKGKHRGAEGADKWLNYPVGVICRAAR